MKVNNINIPVNEVHKVTTSSGMNIFLHGHNTFSRDVMKELQLKQQMEINDNRHVVCNKANMELYQKVLSKDFNITLDDKLKYEKLRNL